MISWQRADMEKGRLQGDLKQDKYRSEQYMKYKRNQMRRFTDGKRLKSHYGKRIVSTQTGHVDMILTGRTFESFKVREATNKYVVYGVDPEHANKISGNRKLGREIIRPSQENLDKATQKMMETIIDPVLRKWASKNLVITIN